MITHADILLATSMFRPSAWKTVLEAGITSDFMPNECHRDLFEAMLSQTRERRRHTPAAIVAKTKLEGTKHLINRYISSVESIVTNEIDTVIRNVIVEKRRSEIALLASAIAKTSSTKNWGSDDDVEKMRGACKAIAGLGGSLTMARKLETIDDEAVRCEFVSHIEKNRELFLSGVSIGISTGVADVDKCLGGGFRPGRMYLVGGRTGGGKSQFAVQATLAAMNSDHKVLFFSAEMHRNDVLKRMFANLADIKYSILDQGSFDKSVIDKAKEFSRVAISSDLIKVFHDFDRSISSIEGIIEVEMQSKKPPSIAIIDYAQMLRPSQSHRDKLRELQDISSTLKAITIKHPITLLVLVQLNRAAETEGPELSNIMGNDSFAHDCDGAILLNVTEESKREKWATIKLRKMRHGESSNVMVGIDFSVSKFFDLTPSQKLEIESKLENEEKKPKRVDFGDVGKRRNVK